MMIVRLQQASRPAASAPAAASHDSAGAVGLRILAAEVPLLAAALARHPGRARARRRRHRTAYRWGRTDRRRHGEWCRQARAARRRRHRTANRWERAYRPRRGAWRWRRRRRAAGRTRRLRVWVRARVRIWVRDQLALVGRRWRRRRHDLDFGEETAGLAPELAAEVDGVEGPGDEHLLLLVHHLLEDEPATLLDAAEDLVNLASAAAA